MNVPQLNDIDEVTREWLVRLASEYGLEPDHLQAACEAAYGSPLQETDDLVEMARALKVFAPLHEQMLRQQIAEWFRSRIADDGTMHSKVLTAMAGEIARGDSDAR